MSDISKPTTIQTKETKQRFDEGWERIFGKPKKKAKKK
jgi:hypothetical protein